jgi:hypothetical protein
MYKEILDWLLKDSAFPDIDINENALFNWMHDRTKLLVRFYNKLIKTKTFSRFSDNFQQKISEAYQ